MASCSQKSWLTALVVFAGGGGGGFSVCSSLGVLGLAQVSACSPCLVLPGRQQAQALRGMVGPGRPSSESPGPACL